MTRMLASVANAAEANVVLRHGADVIDLKDPGRGALGAVPLETARDTIRSVAKRRETSATLGDAPYNQEGLLAHARALAAMGVDYLKLSVERPTLGSLGDAMRLLSSRGRHRRHHICRRRPGLRSSSATRGPGLQGRHAGHP